MMQVLIRGVSQEFSLETNENYSYMAFVLPDGTEARALIDDETLQHIVTLTVKNGGAAPAHRGKIVPPAAPQLTRSEGPARMPEGRDYSPMSLDGEGPVEFGGNYSETEEGSLAAMGEQLRAAEERVTSATAGGDPSGFSPAKVRAAAARLREPPKPQTDLPQPQWDDTPVALPVRAVGRVVAHVSADERGNPVLQGNNIVDTNQLVGGNGEGEEDGVGPL